MKIIKYKKIPNFRIISIGGISVYKREHVDNIFKYKIFGLPIYSRKEFIPSNDIIGKTNSKDKKEIKKEEVTVPRKVVSENKNKKTSMVEKITKSNEYLMVAVRLTGGLGDLLVAANYLYALNEKVNIGNVRWDIYAHTNIVVARTVFRGMGFVNSISTMNDIKDDSRDYDLFIEIQRYPFIRFQDKKKVYRHSPELLNVIFLWEKFRIENTRFWLRSPWFDGQNKIETVKGRKRIQQPDVYGYLGLGEEFKPNIFIGCGEIETLKKFNIYNKKFITIHRGVDSKQDKDSTKLWPWQYYNILIKHIKDNYKDILIVQLGVTEERCPEFDGVDVYLAGKTNLEEVKVLLKYAKVHIDGEGGFVHLRHALHGGVSIVFFGPTAKDFYGYQENINLSGCGCCNLDGCEWVSPVWQKKCVAGHSKNECMYAISPEVAYEAVHKVIGG